MLDSAGMVELLHAGLEGEDTHIAKCAAITLDGLCHYNEATASAVLDERPNLATALVDVFCNGGICEKYTLN